MINVLGESESFKLLKTKWVLLLPLNEGFGAVAVESVCWLDG